MATNLAGRRYQTWYAVLLRLYPRPFRLRFGEEMAQIAARIRQRGDEVIGHGYTNSERQSDMDEATEGAMIHSVVDFRGVKVRDVMLPSAKVVALHPSASTQEALKLGADSDLDRLPVVPPEGELAGLINVLEILLDQNGNKPLGNYVRRIVTITEEEPAYRVVQQLRAARLSLAAVVDKKKNFRGIVSMEDLIRRLVSSSEARV